MINVAVSTLVFGGGNTEAPLPKVSLKLVSERLTAREIIANSVQQQMQTLLAEHRRDFQRIRRQLDKQYLEQAEVEHQAQLGKVALAKNAEREPNVEREIDKALRAFKNRTFKMFVDGSEVARLDESCTLTEGSKVSFIRLIPLVGG